MTAQDAQKAMDENRVVWIKYKDAKGQLSEREVDIYTFDDFDFQVFDHKREQIREFLFERVVDFKITDETFTRRPGIAGGVNKRNNRKNLWTAEIGENNTCRCPNCGTTISLKI